MLVTLLVSDEEIRGRLAASTCRRFLRPTTSRRQAPALRCQAPKGWRSGTKTADVEGLGRGRVEYERIDGTIDVRVSLAALERYLARQERKAVRV